MKLPLEFIMGTAFILPVLTRAAGPVPIDLRSAALFTLLATATTTTTGGGIINRDVVLSPTGSQGIPPGKINGTIYNGGPIAAQAELDFGAEPMTARNSARKPWSPAFINLRRARMA